MLNQICILNPLDGHKFKFFEELICHEARLAHVCWRKKKNFKYEIQIEILEHFLIQKCDPLSF